MQWSMKIDSSLKKKTRNYLSWRNKKKPIRKEIENYLLHAAVESYEYVTLKMDPRNELGIIISEIINFGSEITKTCDKLKDKVVFVQYNYPLIKWIRSPKKIKDKLKDYSTRKRLEFFWRKKISIIISV